MIKVKSISLNPSTMKAEAVLFSDTKAEVESTEVSEIQGFPANYELDFGSSVMTASGELAYMKSDNNWNWV